MKIKLDENIPASLGATLKSMGHDVDTVLQEKRVGSPDREIWQAAKQEKRFFITQDLDFSDIYQFQPGTHPGIMVVRLGNPSRRRLIERISRVFYKESVEDWKSNFVILTNRKLRIRHS